MRLRRGWIAIAFGVLLGTAWMARRGEAQPDTVKQIVPGVWFREGDIKKGHSNNTIIEMKDYLIVVDANFPDGARLVMEAARKLSPKPVKIVFDTHHHGDHAYGNAVWTRAGAMTIAYQGVAEEMKRYEPKRWQGTDRPDVRSLKLATAEPPRETFTKSPHVIEDNTRRVELHFFGWAHTRGDGFAYLPKDKVLVTGDAVTNGAYNFIGDGNIGNWPNVIRAARKLAVTHVLPGHGGPGGPELMDGQRLFFEELLKAVRAEVKAGAKLEDLVTMGDKDQPRATRLKLPDSVKNWVGKSFPGQVRDAFRELTQGKPAGDLPH